MSGDQPRYADLLGDLRRAYDGGAERRDAETKAQWKLDLRAGFLQRVRGEGKRRLLEIGAGTGQDAVFFRDNGLEVVATDLSEEMVARCRAKGLDARVMDFLHLDFPEQTFDAVHAMNCLLHVPNADLPDVLHAIRRIMAPGGLLFMGVYGADEPREGPNPDDWHVPPRFFSFRADEQIERLAGDVFDIVEFRVLRADDPEHYQALTLRRPEPSA